VWRPLRAGVEFEWLPFALGFSLPAARTPGWTFTYQFARFLLPSAFTTAKRSYSATA